MELPVVNHEDYFAKIGKAFGMQVMAWSENLNLDTCKELED